MLKSPSYEKWQNNCLKETLEFIFKTPVDIGKIHGALLTAVCGFSSMPQREGGGGGAAVAPSTKSPNMASVYIVTRMPTHFTDLSEISACSLKSFEAWREMVV